jgi:hypothetical protein
MGSPLYGVPLDKRPPPDVRDYLQMILFNTFFGLSMIALHTLQLFNLALFRIHPSTRRIYNTIVDWHKDVRLACHCESPLRRNLMKTCNT